MELRGLNLEITSMANWKMSKKVENSGHSDLVISVYLVSPSTNLQRSVRDMKALWSTTLVGDAIIVKKKNGCHLKNICYINLLFYVHLLGHMCIVYAKNECSMIKLGGLSTDHDDDARWWHWTTTPDNDTWRTILYCICSLAFMPNEPIIYKIMLGVLTIWRSPSLSTSIYVSIVICAIRISIGFHDKLKILRRKNKHNKLP